VSNVDQTSLLFRFVVLADSILPRRYYRSFTCGAGINKNKSQAVSERMLHWKRYGGF